MTPRESKEERLGRRLGLVVYFLLVIWVAGFGSYSIIRVVFGLAK